LRKSAVKLGKTLCGKRFFASLLTLIMLFSVFIGLPPQKAEAALITSSILNNFVTSVSIEDSNGNPIFPSPPAPPSPPTYIGQDYKFTIVFRETPTLQLAYDAPYPNGRLYYQLPAGLSVVNPVDKTPIQIGNGNIVGWYTINTSGLVTVWFDNVDQNGVPTTNGANYIDLTDVIITLEIYAQLTEDSGGDFNFGGDITINVPPPVPPPPSLSMTKQSRYDPVAERIYYMITITALGAPVSNITLTDTTTAPPGTNVNNAFNITAINNPSAINGLRYSLNESTNFTPMAVTWAVNNGPDDFSGNPTTFSYNFSDLTLAPGNYITVRYYLDIPTLITKNSPALGDLLTYDFTIRDVATVTGNDVPPVTDNTDDHVKKRFPVSKTGVFGGSNPWWIDWTITIGNGTQAVNGGIVTDTLSAPLFLPADTSIQIALFEVGGTAIPIMDATEPTLNFTSSPAYPNARTFNFTIPSQTTNRPSSTTPYGPIGRAVITFRTAVTTPPPGEGMPGIIYNNNVNFDFGGADVGGGGTVPLVPAPVPMTKTTSGLCGNPTTGYYVDYTITAQIPGSAAIKNFWLQDVLTIQPGNVAIPNIPTDLEVTVSAPGGETLNRTNAFITGTNQNTWRIYFGSTGDNAPDWAPFPGSGSGVWQYSSPQTLTVSYRINLTTDAANLLRSSSSNQLSNAVYLINFPGEPILSGSNQNSVGGSNVNDSWPIFKSVSPTAGNPALFNYNVLLKGGFTSNSTRPLLSAGSNRMFVDTFDNRLEYVGKSFYVVDTSNGYIYAPPAPPGDVSITPGTNANTMSVDLSTLVRYSAPPSQPGATTVAPYDSNWYTYKRNYQINYQMKIRDPLLEIPQVGIRNTVQIQVDAANPIACVFDNGIMTTYRPNPMSKKLTTDGSDLVKADIIINPDGGVTFTPPSGPAPTLVTAKDVVSNLMIYTDTIKMYTQGKNAGGVWDGNWVEQTVHYNDNIAWSVNVVSTDEVDFIIPNSTPVRITYDALCTLPPNAPPQSIGNTISIYGDSSSDGNNSYVVGDSKAGAGGSALKLRLFKKDPINNINLFGATFDLYVTLMPGYNAPLGLTDAMTVNGVTFYRLMQGITTDMLGVAIFDDIRITATYNYLFMLVETGIPDGYGIKPQSPNPFENCTFFTINPRIPSAMLSAAQTALGGAGFNINQISDFITIDNNPEQGTPLTLRIRKLFFERGTSGFTRMNMSNPQVQASLQNLQIRVTDPLRNTYTFNLQQLISNQAVIDLKNLFGGVFMIEELNNGRPNYTVRTNPQMPIHPWVWPSPTREVVIQILNIYTPVEKSPQTGVERNIALPITLLALSAICITGAEVCRRHHKKSKNQK